MSWARVIIYGGYPLAMLLLIVTWIVKVLT